MKDLVIMGGGHAAEMVEIVDRINRVKKTWNLLGLTGRNSGMSEKSFN